LEAALGAVRGVRTAAVDWRSGRAQVVHAPGVDVEALVRAVAEASRGTQHHYRAVVVTTQSCGKGTADDA
jgi:hypothetical protein